MTGTATLTRLADQAVAARGGAELYRFEVDGRIPDHAFAANPDGSVTVKGIDLLKAGTFNGLGLVDADLASMVEWYGRLRDSGIFVPPFRLDHSWSVLSVIGYFENLETYVRVDTTDSMEKTFLRGDVRVTGSVDYKPAVIVDAMKRGALRLRSSELGYYVTNSGLEIPLAFYGCAFVDIPAVEGLAPIALSKSARRPSPHSIVNLTADPEGPTMTPEQTARLAALRSSTDLSAEESAELVELEAVEATSTGDPAPVEEPAAGDEEEGEAPAGDPVEEDPAGDEGDEGVEPDEDEAAAVEEDPVPDPAPGTDTPPDPDAVELAALRAQVAALRNAEADRQLATLRSAGVLNARNEEDASALLRHDDEDVRRRAGAVLGSIPAVVALGRRSGTTVLSGGTSNAGGPQGTLGLASMTGAEGGALWASLTPEDRRAHRDEYDSWIAARQETGVRD